MVQSARKPPTLADVEALPPNVKGEIIEGVLYTMTRLRSPHQATNAFVASDLLNPFGRGRGGPGGWWILPEPGIELDVSLWWTPFSTPDNTK